MSFNWASKYLLSTINETISRREPSRLERMQSLLEELGNPQLARVNIDDDSRDVDRVGF